MARLIDAENYRNLFNEEFKKTMELIRKGETHLDTLAEGFTEADRVIRALPTIDPVTAAAEALGMSPDRLRELAQAKKKGRLVVLPCDVGDKLYDVTLGEVREKIVVSLSMFVPESVNHLVIHAENFRNAVTSYELQDIGKTVFLTREAAEAALDAMGGENNA